MAFDTLGDLVTEDKRAPEHAGVRVGSSYIEKPSQSTDEVWALCGTEHLFGLTVHKLLHCRRSSAGEYVDRLLEFDVVMLMNEFTVMHKRKK